MKKPCTLLEIKKFIYVLLVAIFTLAFSGFVAANNSDSLKLLLKKTDKANIKAEIYAQLAKINQINNKTQAIRFIDSGLEICLLSNGLDSTTSNLFFSKGSIRIKKNELDSALECFYKSIEIKKHIKDEKGIADCFFKIGQILYSKAEYAEAKAKYNKSLNIYSELKDSLGIANCYQNIGMVNRHIGDYVEAIKLYQKALAACPTARSSAESGG